MKMRGNIYVEKIFMEEGNKKSLQCNRRFRKHICQLSYKKSRCTLGYKGDSEEWKQWIAETVQNAEYDCNIAPTGKEKVFTLSTCVGDGSSPYRLVIHAVTVAQKEVANAEKEAS